MSASLKFPDEIRSSSTNICMYNYRLKVFDHLLPTCPGKIEENITYLIIAYLSETVIPFS